MSLCSTQWRVGLNGPYGLDYLAVCKVAELHKVELDADTFARLQVLEDEQLVIWAEQKPKKED
jgi:hypothetical protein